MVKPFDLRDFMPPGVKETAKSRRANDRFNGMMVLIGDIPLKTLLTTRLSELSVQVIQNFEAARRGRSKWLKAAAILKAGNALVSIAGDHTFAQIVGSRRRKLPNVYRAISGLRKLGVLLPGPLERDDLNEQYFRRIVIGRVIRILGNFTPRSFFEKPMADFSAIERAVILEAKMLGMADPCGGEPNGKVCRNGTECVASNNPGTSCYMNQGRCMGGSDPEEELEFEPSPGGSGNL